MGPLDFLNHVLNFVAPAIWLAISLALLSRMFIKKVPSSRSLMRQAAVNFLVCLLVLVLGLWFFGRDGKMLTYSIMAVLAATSQWTMARAWQT